MRRRIASGPVRPTLATPSEHRITRLIDPASNARRAMP